MLREPLPAAFVSAVITYTYLKLKSAMNNEPNHKFIKPAFLVAVLVYFIIYIGQTNTEPLSI
jgi:formate hydrogenlyase subunit 4